MQTVLGADADTQAVISSMELKTTTDLTGKSVAKLTQKNLQAAVSTGKLSEEQAVELANLWGIKFATDANVKSSLPKWIAGLNTINTQIKETGRLSSENLSKISEAFSSEDYPEMTKALYDYRRGMIEATDVFDVLQECYEKDTKAYAEKLAENLSDSVDFYNSVLEYENDNITKLGEAYSKDFENWTI